MVVAGYQAGLDEGLCHYSFLVLVYMQNNRVHSKLKRIMTEHPRPNTGREPRAEVGREPVHRRGPGERGPHGRRPA